MAPVDALVHVTRQQLVAGRAAGRWGLTGTPPKSDILDEHDVKTSQLEEYPHRAQNSGGNRDQSPSQEYLSAGQCHRHLPARTCPLPGARAITARAIVAAPVARMVVAAVGLAADRLAAPRRRRALQVPTLQPALAPPVAGAWARRAVTGVARFLAAVGAALEQPAAYGAAGVGLFAAAAHTGARTRARGCQPRAFGRGETAATRATLLEEP